MGCCVGSCYNPHNFQCRALTCKVTYSRHILSPLQLAPNLTDVMKNLHLMSWIGITELYHESICTFTYTLYKNLANNCICLNDGNKTHDIVYRNITHNGNILFQLVFSLLSFIFYYFISLLDCFLFLAPSHSISNVNQIDMAKIDILTKADQQLYLNALLIFIERLRHVEADLNQHILCKDKALKLYAQTSYTCGENCDSLRKALKIS